MKTIITASEGNIKAQFDQRFGRAHWFCVFNDENNEITFIPNENIDAQAGAGSKTAEMVVEMKIDKVISGHFGPKAKDLLEKFDIQMIEMDTNASIEDLINKIRIN